jgi:ureidoglycolate hydrolase
MAIDPSLLETHTHEESSFLPLVNFGSWRVAILNYVHHLLPQNLKDMQRHDETDEVFVLLKGRCILFVGNGQEESGQIHAVDMVPQTLYNVKRGTWHTHTLSEDASVLVVENRETNLDNSPMCQLTDKQTSTIVAETQRLWST